MNPSGRSLDDRSVSRVLCLTAILIPATFGISLSEEPKSNTPPSAQVVIAEGVGATADEALKDAFRNAVRQVVGAVVDTETLVKNDDVIDDKVLTYSHGFVKKWDRVPGSEKFQGGLHRLKIKASVERRGVIEKLKAANVTVKEIDGKGLFAEAVTQADAEKDAAAILKKQFEGFPQSCITASIIGKPEIVDKTENMATVKLTVQIEPDLKAYKAFTTQLIPLLDKLAKDKGKFTSRFEPVAKHFGDWLILPEAERYRIPRGAADANLHKSAEIASLAVATTRTKAGDRIDYKHYILDSSLRPVLLAVASRKGQCKLRLLDEGGTAVATDSCDPFFTANSNPISPLVVRIEPGNPILRIQVSPVFGDSGICHRTYLTIPRTITLSHDQLKSVKDAKVEVTFDE